MVVGVLMAPTAASMLGGVYNTVAPHNYNGLYAGDSDEFSVNASGGTLALATANTATSTGIVGCIQSYATSTETAIKQMLFASTTITAANTYGGGTQRGFVTWGYGTCPNL